MKKPPSRQSFKEIESPVGKLVLIAEREELIAVLWKGKSPVSFPEATRDDSNKVLLRAEKQLIEYFLSERKEFDLPLKFQGTPFQVSVWKALAKIPYGKTLSYQEHAGKIKKPKAFRAVASAIGKNPLSIIVPCHRVIGKDGSLRGFGGGLPNKEKLLKLEGY